MKLINFGVKKLELLKVLKQLKTDLENLESVESTTVENMCDYTVRYLNIITQFTNKYDLKYIQNVLKYPCLGELKRLITDFCMGPNGINNLKQYTTENGDTIYTGKSRFSKNVREKCLAFPDGSRLYVLFDFKYRGGELQNFIRQINSGSNAVVFHKNPDEAVTVENTWWFNYRFDCIPNENDTIKGFFYKSIVSEICETRKILLNQLESILYNYTQPKNPLVIREWKRKQNQK